MADNIQDLFEKAITDLEDFQKTLVNICGLDSEGLPFNVKKLLQSANRRLMPIGMSTGIIVTTNHRNWRHLIEMRTAPYAEEEIRKVFVMIAEDLAEGFPAIYQDMVTNKDESITFEHGRV
jgi:thymidylate synthase (FAD)